MKKLAIVIPAWYNHGLGLIHLKQLLDNLSGQTFISHCNVYISVHSNSRKEKSHYGALFEQYPIITRYSFNSERIGNWPCNANSALKMISNEPVIKIMFQDDFFLKKNALEIIYQSTFFNETWVASGCAHALDADIGTANLVDLIKERDLKLFNAFIPKWVPEMELMQTNTIGCPSVISFPSSAIALFDQRLKLIGDIEFYLQLVKQFGLPVIISETLICSRIGDGQVTSTIDRGERLGRTREGFRIQNRKDLHVYESSLALEKHGLREPYSLLDAPTLIIKAIVLKVFRYLKRGAN